MKTFIFLLFPISLFSQAWTCGDTILDMRDGQSYNTVQIGAQCWMAQNLNYGQHILSHDSAFSHSEAINNGIIEKYCLGNDPTNCQAYGGLYDWNEMMDYSTTQGVQGVCPSGWHLPSDNEWKELVVSLGMSQVQANSMGWIGTNEGDLLKFMGGSGFSSLYGIGRNYDGKMGDIVSHAYYWSSTNNSPYHAFYYHLSDVKQEIYRNYSYKSYGYSVRCVRDTGLITGSKDLNPNMAVLKVSPNPAKTMITVKIPQAFRSPYDISLMNINGQILKRKINQSAQKSMFKTDHLPKGIYLIKVISDSNMETIKVLLD